MKHSRQRVVRRHQDQHCMARCRHMSYFLGWREVSVHCKEAEKRDAISQRPTLRHAEWYQAWSRQGIQESQTQGAIAKQRTPYRISNEAYCRHSSTNTCTQGDSARSSLLQPQNMGTENNQRAGQKPQITRSRATPVQRNRVDVIFHQCTGRVKAGPSQHNSLHSHSRYV